MWGLNESRKCIQTRSRGLAILLVGAAVFIGLRVFWLQVVDGRELQDRNQSQIEDNRILQSPRGTIFDRNGRKLAVSSVTKSLYADPTMLNKSPEEVATLLAPYLSVPKPRLVKALSEDTAFVWLERMLDKPISDEVERVIKENKLVGLNFVKESKRYYPNGELAAQVLGFVGIDDKGLDGIEMVLDDQIRGNQMEQVLITDGRNTPILGSTMAKLLPNKQRSVYLTIDTTIQFIAEQALDKAMKSSKPKGAATIIMDPKTGEILAMASRPTYDPNHYDKSTQQAFTNRAVTNIYEPGSTFKPIMASAFLMSGKWKVNDIFHDTGVVKASGHEIRNWDEESNGDVDLRKILMFSINTGMAHIGMLVGGDILTQYAKAYGFGKETGIELPGEGTGILFNPKDMRPIDVASMSIGQGVAVTPLQMVQAFSAIANGGNMVKPHLIEKIVNADGSVYKSSETTIVGQPISQSVAHTIASFMEDEVSEGGGNNAFIEGYEFGGKTGTAQKLNETGSGYADGKYISSFIGLGPIEDPQFIVLVVIDEPQGVYYGGQIAAPVFKDIMSQLVRYRGLHPTLRADYKGNPDAPVQKLPQVERKDGKIVLPDFRGWNMRDVMRWIGDTSLGLVTNGSGTAVSQHPLPGEEVEESGSVTVNFSHE